MNEEEQIKKALLCKALGYDTDEVVEEYALDEDGQEKLLKRKVTKKHICPDIAAMKVYIEKYMPAEMDVKAMSEQELLDEKAKLIKILKEEFDGDLPM